MFEKVLLEQRIEHPIRIHFCFVVRIYNDYTI